MSPRLLRAVGVVLTVLVAGAFATACGASESGLDHGAEADGKPSKVTVAFQAIPNGALIVKRRRWLESALGVPVEWVQFDSGADVNRAVAAGDVDIGLAGSSPVTSGIAAGVPYRVAWIYDVIGDNEQLVVRAGSGVRDLRGLAGRKVGVPFGSTTHYSLLTALARAGVDPEAVEVLDLQPEDIVAAWRRGDIDAAYVWTPSLDELKADGGRVLVSSAELARSGAPTGDLGVVRAEFAQRYPRTVSTWLEQENRAVALYRDRPREAATDVGLELGIPAEEALGQMRQLIWLDRGEQLAARELGRPGRPGDLARQLTDTARFLRDQGLSDRAPSRAEFERALAPEYLERARE